MDAYQRDGGNTAASGNDYGSTASLPRDNYWSLPMGNYAVVVEHIEVRNGYNGDIKLWRDGVATNLSTTPRVFSGLGEFRVRSYYARYRIWFANCTPTPTPQPTWTPTPTVDPTSGGGGGGGSGGSGGGGSSGGSGGGGSSGGSGGGGGSGTGTTTPTLDPAMTGTPAPWCGYVPSHPCWVTWSTAQAVRVEGTITAALDATSVAGLADAIATRVPGAAYAPTITAVAQALEAGPQAAGYSRRGGDISVSAYDIEMIDIEMYQYDCIAIDVFDTRVCTRYGYIRRLWLGPVEVPLAMVVRAAMALAAVAFVIRR